MAQKVLSLLPERFLLPVVTSLSLLHKIPCVLLVASGHWIKSLAYARHFPAIDWMASYTEYLNDLEPWYIEHLGEEYLEYRSVINNLLQEENKLMEIVKLVGADVLPDDQKLVIQIARVIRIGFLQQNAFHPDDTYVPIEKQRDMMKVIGSSL